MVAVHLFALEGGRVTTERTWLEKQPVRSLPQIMEPIPASGKSQRVESQRPAKVLTSALLTTDTKWQLREVFLAVLPHLIQS